MSFIIRRITGNNERVVLMYYIRHRNFFFEKLRKDTTKIECNKLLNRSYCNFLLTLSPE